MARFQPEVQNRVKINTIYITEYELNFLLWQCREASIPAICLRFMRGTYSGTKLPYRSSSNGVTTYHLTIRESDAVEFILRFPDYIRSVVSWKNGEHASKNINGSFSDECRRRINATPGIEPFLAAYKKRWRC